MKNYFLSIDNGGTNTKVVIFDFQGKQISSSAFPTLCIEEETDFREVDLENMWESISFAIKDVLQKAELTGADIAGISCVGHGKGLYMLDKDKKIFANGILSTDERGNALAEKFEKQVSEIWAISRQHVVAPQSPVLLRWLKDNNPGQYEKIGYILSAKDFVRFKLTNQLAQEIGDASGNNLIHLAERKFDQRLFDFFGIPEAQDFLSDLIDYGDIAGEVTEEVAELTGLLAGTPVVGGLFDIDACALASGVLDDTKINMIAGTWNINIYPADAPAQQASGLMNSIYPGDKYLVESSSATSAGNLNSIIQMLMNEEKENAEKAGTSIYDVLEDFLAYTDASYCKVIFLPFLYGSNVSANAQSCFFGLKNTTTKSELIRSVYEGIAFAHKAHLDLLMKERGNQSSVIRLSGGAVNSQQWTQMFADVMGTTVETVEATEQGALGGAIATAVGLGIYPSLEQAIEKMVHVGMEAKPRTEMTKLYQRKYKTYQSLLSSLAGAWDDLEEMRKEMEHA